MSGSDRQLYLTATVLDQAFLDATAQDNLVTNLEMVVDIESGIGTIRASDRNKYVGSNFYEARCKFPNVQRQIGKWLSSTVEFSNLTIELNNADGKFNPLEIGGADYTGFVGKSVELKVGLRDVASTYRTIFKGIVTPIGGAGRTLKSVVLTARDNFQTLTIDFPTTAFTAAVFPDIETDRIGTAVPVIYGDWTDPATLNRGAASVLAYCVNGVAAKLNPTTNPKFFISNNALTYFDPANVYINRDNRFVAFDPSDIVNVAGDNRSFEIIQNGATVILPPPGTIDPGPGQQWTYSGGETVYVRVKGKDLGAYSDNPIEQARDLLESFGGLAPTDFHANWDTYRDKAAPAQSAIATIKSRIWVQTPQPLIAYALSMLTQVRLEAFVDQANKLKINSLHFEDWPASPDFTVKNWDVVKDTFQPTIDEQNNFNRARGLFSRDPSTNETVFTTAFLRNQAAIDQSGILPITKDVTFPNLYVAQDVLYQLTEILRLASATPELIQVVLTSRSFLRELGDWVKVSVKIGSTQFDNVPAMVRLLGYDPAGLKMPHSLWSMGAVRFPGWSPPGTGIVGGFDATITAE